MAMDLHYAHTFTVKGLELSKFKLSGSMTSVEQITEVSAEGAEAV